MNSLNVQNIVMFQHLEILLEEKTMIYLFANYLIKKKQKLKNNICLDDSTL